MKRKKTIVIGTSAVILAGIAGGGVAWATAGDDAGERVGGPGADRAAKTALAHVGTGTLEGVERGDDGSAAWEVEIVKPDGSTVEVRLGAAFEVLGAGADDRDGSETDSDSG